MWLIKQEFLLSWVTNAVGFNECTYRKLWWLGGHLQYVCVAWLLVLLHKQGLWFAWRSSSRPAASLQDEAEVVRQRVQAFEQEAERKKKEAEKEVDDMISDLKKSLGKRWQQWMSGLCNISFLLICNCQVQSCCVDCMSKSAICRVHNNGSKVSALSVPQLYLAGAETIDAFEFTNKWDLPDSNKNLKIRPYAHFYWQYRKPARQCICWVHICKLVRSVCSGAYNFMLHRYSHCNNV